MPVLQAERASSIIDNFFPLDFLTMIHSTVLLPGTCFNRNGKQVSLRMAVSVLGSSKFK